MKPRYLIPFCLFSLALQAATPALVPAETAATSGPWSVRLGATYVDAQSTTIGAGNVQIEDKLIPEFDIDYKINDTWSLELVLTVPQEHDVKLGGAPLGNFKELPPTLLAKYAFGDLGGFRPYVGAGVNFTLIFDETLGAGAITLDHYSVGPAAQAGFDYALDERWSINFDVKRIMLRTDVYAGGSSLGELRLDPWLFRLGLGYAF